MISYFSEMMGLPIESLSSDYWFPAYDNVTYTIAPNLSFCLFYPVNTGSLEVKSTNGTPLIASIRFAYIESQVPLVVRAFSEMLGLPAC